MEEEIMNINLDNQETQIEDSALLYRPVSSEKRNFIDSIIDEAKKTKNINIRISEYDLDRLRDKSAAEGLPYQTLIASILHKYVTNQLVDEQVILKSIQMLKATQG